jgi:hypothetical protein
MSSFHLYLAAKLCLEGMFADIASALGWEICLQIAKISYYPFIGKVNAEITVPSLLPVRARLTASVPVHDLTPAVEEHINSRSNDTNKSRWYSQTAMVDCEGAGNVARCSGNERHYQKQIFFRERGTQEVNLIVDVGFSLFGHDFYGTAFDVKLLDGGAMTYEWADDAPGTDIGTRYDAKCLDYNYSNSNVYMRDCNGNNTQKFFFDGERIKNARDDYKCLDYHLEWKNVHMIACNGKQNQKWYFEGETIRTRSDNQCLDYNYEDKNVYMHNCNSGDNQKWTFRGRNLRTRHDSKCVDYNLENNKVNMHSCNTESNQKFFFANEQIKTEHDGKCMEYDPGSKIVNMGTCNEESNQKWYFKGDHLVSRHEDKCVEYHTEDNNVYVNNCDAVDNQQWFFE